MAAQPKVFCIGFMKTGTTTLHEALTLLGYRVSPNSWRLIRPIIHSDWKKVKAHAEKWDALEDTPIPMVYRELDQMFPNSKFILTERNPDSWYKSVSHHIGSLRRPVNELTFGKGKGLPKKDKEHTIRIFEQHNAAVKAYFQDRPDQLLICDLSENDGWDTLTRFLDQPTPESPFPHANKTDYSSPGMSDGKLTFDLVKKKIKFTILLAYYNARGFIPKR